MKVIKGFITVCHINFPLIINDCVVTKECSMQVSECSANFMRKDLDFEISSEVVSESREEDEKLIDVNRL